MIRGQESIQRADDKSFLIDFETEVKETRPLVESRTKDLLDRLGIKDVDKIEYEPVRKEIISKLKYVGLREGGIININKLIRPL